MDSLEFLEKQRDNLQARILELTESTIAEYGTGDGDNYRNQTLRELETSLDRVNAKLARLGGVPTRRRASFNRSLAGAIPAATENTGSGLYE